MLVLDVVGSAVLLEAIVVLLVATCLLDQLAEGFKRAWDLFVSLSSPRTSQHIMNLCLGDDGMVFLAVGLILLVELSRSKGVEHKVLLRVALMLLFSRVHRSAVSLPD